ncbi:MAG: M12 family metallo-peptidase, partial [Halieaceae bacterium]
DGGYGTPLASDDLYLTTVAVEIDKGLYSQFGSATAANNYIAQLFAYNSVVYEREIKTRLKVGDIFLLTEESDPYTDTDSTKTRLDEVRDYWRAN